MGLFEEFDKVSQQDWIEKINIDLKGKDYQETLVWKTKEGIDIHPFYNTFEKQACTPLKINNDWKIRETVVIEDLKTANSAALEALKGGANAIQFIGKIGNHEEMDTLLSNIQTDIIDVHFYNTNPLETAQYVQLKQGSISYDVLENSNDVDLIVELINTTENIKTITINPTKNSSIIAELAFSLSKGVEYLNLLTDKGIEAKTIANNMQFSFGISTNYFFEIAKLRAARKLWQSILSEYKVDKESMCIHSETSIEIASEEDVNYNILRNTTKAMSAIIGGCDSLTVRPHDADKLSFSNRIARNIQHLLKEESFFDKVNNPADGSYYIEHLTEEIARKAWKKFQEIESKGGFLTYIKNEQSTLNA